MLGGSGIKGKARAAVMSPAGQRVMAAAGGRRVLTCIGDSHLEPLWIVAKRQLLPRTTLRVTSVGGATGSGIANPNSKTAALPKFQAATAALQRGSWLLACLGEVDAGFLVFAQAERDGSDPHVHADVALKRYQAFLQREVLDRGARPILVSAIPPTIEDYADWRGLQGQRRAISATWQQRAEMTAYWNKRCAEWSADAGVAWLDLTPHVADPMTGRVLAEWMNSDREDHHLDPVKHAELLVELLRNEGFR